MYIHTHHVSQSVGHEHGMCAGLYSLVGIAFGQSQLLESVKHEAAHREVYVSIFYTGFSHGQCMVMSSLHDGVDFQLALGKLAVYGECARVVGAVMVDGLGTGIAEGESAALQDGH